MYKNIKNIYNSKRKLIQDFQEKIVSENNNVPNACKRTSGRLYQTNICRGQMSAPDKPLFQKNLCVYAIQMSVCFKHQTNNCLFELDVCFRQSRQLYKTNESVCQKTDICLCIVRIYKNSELCICLQIESNRPHIQFRIIYMRTMADRLLSV